MKFIINGACGRMGREVAAQLSEGEIAARVDAFGDGEEILRDISEFSGECDGIIDFSSHLSAASLCSYASASGIPLVIASTGQTDEEKELIERTAEKIPIFFSYNMSVGVAALCDMVRRAAALFPDGDIEIIETHHKMKKDAPSGTALMLAAEVMSVRDGKIVCGRNGECVRRDGEIGIHSVRLSNVVGKHEVIISDGNETLTLTHEAHSRTLFARGAVRAARFICGKPAGLYNMHMLLGDL